MNRLFSSLAAAVCLGMAVLAASAGAMGTARAEGMKIGFVATLSGPASLPGRHMRDGFLLAVKQKNDRLGGLQTKVVVVDDKLDIEVARQSVANLINEEKVDFLAGITFNNIMLAVYPEVVKSETIFIGAGAGPGYIAGKGCSRYFFSTASQSDQNNEAMGRYARERGYGRVMLLAPDYRGAKEAIAAFKRHYSGEIVGEFYSKLGQTDFSADIAMIGKMEPDAIFTFMPGQMGVSLVEQFAKAGLKADIAFLSAYTLDETTLPVMKDAAEGLLSVSDWSPDLNTEENNRFVRAFEDEYGYEPSAYAAQGYDAAMLINGAVGMTGSVAEKKVLLSSLRAAPFQSVRGDFRFNSNQFPVHDFYLVEAIRRGSDKYVTEMKTKVFDDVGDSYAGSCRMN